MVIPIFVKSVRRLFGTSRCNYVNQFSSVYLVYIQYLLDSNNTKHSLHCICKLRNQRTKSNTKILKAVTTTIMISLLLIKAENLLMWIMFLNTRFNCSKLENGVPTNIPHAALATTIHIIQHTLDYPNWFFLVLLQDSHYFIWMIMNIENCFFITTVKLQLFVGFVYTWGCFHWLHFILCYYITYIIFKCISNIFIFKFTTNYV